MCHNSRERNACCSTIHVVHPQSVSLSLWVSLPGRDHHRIVGEVPFSALAENSRPEVATSVTPSLLSSVLGADYSSRVCPIENVGLNQKSRFQVRSIGSHGLRDRRTRTDERSMVACFCLEEEEEEEKEEKEEGRDTERNERKRKRRRLATRTSKGWTLVQARPVSFAK
ncbi:hypothetical protein V1478_006542 [Vespula squamosa]|uniref:Uncharacterized protein n=1 Tax=Vespula squamosa TaxID=30214 RepID=A0ABD2B873_VESSQ